RQPPDGHPDLLCGLKHTPPSPELAIRRSIRDCTCQRPAPANVPGSTRTAELNLPSGGRSGLADEEHFPQSGATPLPAPAGVVPSQACGIPLRSPAPSRLAPPPSPPRLGGDVLASRPQERAPQPPHSRAPDRGRPRPWSSPPLVIHLEASVPAVTCRCVHGGCPRASSRADGGLLPAPPASGECGVLGSALASCSQPSQ